MGSVVIQQLDRFGPTHCETLTADEARAYTRSLAQSHYENFSVLSWFVPARLRDDFGNVYAFCRWADDLGDETGDPRKSEALLSWWREELGRCYDGRPRHPVFVALSETISRHDIPRKPFDDLIDAFVQDQRVSRYDTWEQVVDYCTRSADPVGRLVLYLAGHRDAERQRLSDATCTALQLANFWQDVRRDVLERDRVYIPRDAAAAHGLDLELMVKAIQLDERGRFDPKCAACPPSLGMTALRPAYVGAIRELVARTRPLFAAGRGLLPMLGNDIRPAVELFSMGGEAVLTMIERRGYNTMTGRPSLSRAKKMSLMLRLLARRVFAR
jgi:squalene synthase HpnC